MSTQYVDIPNGGGGGGVSSLNTLTGALTLVAGTGITITPSGGDTLTIAATGAGTAITSINLDTTSAQTLTIGTAGTDFNIVNNLVGDHKFNLPTASATVRGALSSGDWTTFNSKQAAGSYITALTGDGTATGPGSAALTLATVNATTGTFGTASSVGTFTVNGKGLITNAVNTSIQIAESQVTNLVSDLAGKQATGNYITGLTGDVTAIGPGSVPATLATVNGNVGSFGLAASVPTITVNAKGLITAAANTSIQIAESQVTNLVSDLAGKQPTGNYITALTGDATASGPGSAALTLATVNGNVGSFGSSTSIPSFTVNAKGLITAASGNVVIAPAGTLSGTPLLTQR